jgi:hypothetical protein
MGCTSCAGPSPAVQQFRARRALRLVKRQKQLLAKKPRRSACGRCANSSAAAKKKLKKNTRPSLRLRATKRTMTSHFMTAQQQLAALNDCKLCTAVPSRLQYPFCDLMYSPDSEGVNFLSFGGGCSF